MIDAYFIDTIPSPRYYLHKNYHTAVQDKHINVNPDDSILAVAKEFQLQKQSGAVCNKQFF